MSEPLINISRKQAFCFAAFLVFYEFLTYIANDMIMPGMIHVVHTFHSSESAIASSLTAYVLGGASLQIFLGPLSDRFGRRPVMLTGAAFFFICTLFIAYSNSMEQFLLARFFEGMGLCFISVIGYAVLQEIFSEMDAVRLISILANISILAPLLGPLAGAFFIIYFDWRSIFFVIAILALVVFAGLWRFMPEPIGAIKKDGSNIPHISLAPRVIFNNYKRLLMNPCFMMGSIMMGIIAVPCIAWIAISPIIIITDAKLSVIEYALWQLPVFGACIVGNFYLRHLTHHKTLKRIIFIGALVSLLGLTLSYLLPLLLRLLLRSNLIWLMPGLSSNFIWLMPGIIIYGLGFAITSGPLYRYVLFSTEVSKGTASAMMSMINMYVQGLGIELSKYIYARHSNIHLSVYFALCGFIYLGGVFMTFRLNLRKEEPNGV